MIVYGIFDPDTDELRYIGRTFHLTQRMQRHYTQVGVSVSVWLRSLNAPAVARELASPWAPGDELGDDKGLECALIRQEASPRLFNVQENDKRLWRTRAA